MTIATQNNSSKSFKMEEPSADKFTIDLDEYEEKKECFALNHSSRKGKMIRNALVTTVLLTVAFVAFSSGTGKIDSSEGNGKGVIGNFFQGSHIHSQKQASQGHHSKKKHGHRSNHTNSTRHHINGTRHHSNGTRHHSNGTRHHSNATRHHSNATKHSHGIENHAMVEKARVRKYEKYTKWFNDHKSGMSPEKQSMYEQKLAIRSQQLTELGFHPEKIEAKVLNHHKEKYEDIPAMISMPGPVLPESFTSVVVEKMEESSTIENAEEVVESSTIENAEEVVESSITENAEDVVESSTTENAEDVVESSTTENAEDVESSALDFGGAPYLVLEEIDRDETSFTQGLTYADGILYESAGLYGQSSVRRLDPNTGEILKVIPMERKYFAEGMTYYEDDGVGKLIQITWKRKTGFIYDASTLEQLQTFTYDTTLGEGWGITYDKSTDSFIVTDGSNMLHFWDRATLQETHRIEVIHPSGVEVAELNEIEYWNGLVLSNVWFQDNIYAIDPVSGSIILDMDFSSLWPKSERGFRNDVFNGISVTDVDDELFVTGKKWPKFYRIKMNLAAFN